MGTVGFGVFINADMVEKLIEIGVDHCSSAPSNPPSEIGMVR
jgi:hypothetical protein